MSQQQIVPIEDTEFAARAQPEESRLVLHFWGNADLRAKEPLDGFLQAADDWCIQSGVAEVVADFRELVFMNSSCLKAIVTWLARVQERPDAQQYRIQFLKEPMAHWQSRSLHVLAAFAPDIVRVD